MTKLNTFSAIICSLESRIGFSENTKVTEIPSFGLISTLKIPTNCSRTVSAKHIDVKPMFQTKAHVTLSKVYPFMVCE